MNRRESKYKPIQNYYSYQRLTVKVDTSAIPKLKSAKRSSCPVTEGAGECETGQSVNSLEKYLWSAGSACNSNY